MRIQVMGAGSWGLALARLLALNEHDVRIWCREEDKPDALRETRESPVFLPGVHIPDQIVIDRTVDPEADLAVLAVPSHGMRNVLRDHPLAPHVVRVSVAKGIENDTLMRMSQVIEDVCGPCPVLALSGPSHAEEVARDLPASVVVAGDDERACQIAQDAFMNAAFRVYTSADIVGVELGGALKNVLAIAAGVCDGLGLGDNAKAALITRGLAEMSRLGVALGADPLTFAGLSGMGDLIVTCESRHSRNRSVGERIGRGESLDSIQGGSPMVAEGVRTTRAVVALAKGAGVEMPIAEQVHRVLFEGAVPSEAIQALMSRDAKPERDF